MIISVEAVTFDWISLIRFSWSVHLSSGRIGLWVARMAIERLEPIARDREAGGRWKALAPRQEGPGAVTLRPALPGNLPGGRAAFTARAAWTRTLNGALSSSGVAHAQREHQRS